MIQILLLLLSSDGQKIEQPAMMSYSDSVLHIAYDSVETYHIRNTVTYPGETYMTLEEGGICAIRGETIILKCKRHELYLKKASDVSFWSAKEAKKRKLRKKLKKVQ